jgi:hypothetical protein
MNSRATSKPLMSLFSMMPRGSLIAPVIVSNRSSDNHDRSSAAHGRPGDRVSSLAAPPIAPLTLSSRSCSSPGRPGTPRGRPGERYQDARSSLCTIAETRPGRLCGKGVRTDGQDRHARLEGLRHVQVLQGPRLGRPGAHPGVSATADGRPGEARQQEQHQPGRAGGLTVRARTAAVRQAATARRDCPLDR